MNDSILTESLRVAWSDLCFFKRNIVSILISCLVGPLLYLVAFGYGLGKGMEVEGLEYITFVIPGIIALTTLSASFNSTATKVLVQRTYYMSFDELMLCPIRVPSVVIGKSLIGVIRGLISCTLLIILGLLLSSELIVTPMLIISIVLSCFTFSFLGICAGLLANSHQTLNLFTSLVIVPMTFLCGTIFSLSALPDFVQVLISVLPLTPVTECIRAAAVGSVFPWASFAMVVIYCAIFYSINYYLLKKRRNV